MRKHADFLLWFEVALLGVLLIAMLTGIFPVSSLELRISENRLQKHMVSDLLQARSDLRTSYVRVDANGYRHRHWQFTAFISGTRPPRRVSGTLRLNCATMSGEQACWEVSDVKRDDAPLELIVSTAVASENVTQWVVIADHVKGRLGPGTGYEVVQSFDKGVAILLLEARGGWGHFQSDDGEVWIAMGYVEPAD